jgi:hypothetical protein
MKQLDRIQPIYQSEEGTLCTTDSAGDPIAPQSSHYSRHNDYDSSFESPKTFLQPEEIRSLTDRKRRVAQVKVLRSMGIEHKVRPDGGIAVLRAHITKVFDGSPEATSRSHQKVASPNWRAI